MLVEDKVVKVVGNNRVNLKAYAKLNPEEFGITELVYLPLLQEIMKENKVFYGFLKCIYASLVTILYNPKVYGKENIPKDGPIVFAGNHRHAFDPVVVMTHTNRFVHYMAKETLFKGIFGFLLRQIGIIKVYRTECKKCMVKKYHAFFALRC